MSIENQKEIELAQAYLRITEEMGPSPQLDAFINYDNSLSDSLGIGLESLSADAQHEIIVIKMKDIAGQ